MPWLGLVSLAHLQNVIVIFPQTRFEAESLTFCTGKDYFKKKIPKRYEDNTVPNSLKLTCFKHRKIKEIEIHSRELMLCFPLY